MKRQCLAFALAPVLLCQFAPGNWQTDKSKRTIQLSELSSGGPPKDGIPSIDRPRFIPLAEATWLPGAELVISLERNGEARAYPLRILIWHELVNDVIGGEAVLVSYCPLCNSAIVFSRVWNGETLEFGVSGMLRNRDMVMYDRQTDSLWQQITGEGLVGAHAGQTLTMLPSQLIPFGEFKRAYPSGVVLGTETGVRRDYGRSPYSGYEFGNQPKEKLVVLKEKKGYRAYPLKLLAERGVWEDKLDGEPIVLFYSRDGLSPVDAADMTRSRPAGVAGVFSPGKERARFARKSGRIVDKETGSEWTVTGLATTGARKGNRLEPIPHGVYFSFAWLAFEPATRIMGQ